MLFARTLQALLYHGMAWSQANVQSHHTPPSYTTVAEELGPYLSSKANIVLPSSKQGQELQVRASTPRVQPGYVAIVQVASEKDVQETIKYANRRSMPFLAVSGGHGWSSSLNNVRNGIQINMRKLNTTRLRDEGNSAIVGGGTMQYEITAALFNSGKRAGPLLGGGHSLLQGRHGFASDNLISARVVLADGSIKTVSNEQHPDLFWAMRGAGHNFGVVTSLEVKVYDASEKWTLVALSFTQDRLEAFFDTWNRLGESGRDDTGIVALVCVVARNEELDEHHPLINLQLIYEGEQADAAAYAAAFRRLSPVSDSTTTDIPWGNVFVASGVGRSSPVCRKDHNIQGHPSSLDAWDPTAMRRGYEVYANVTADKTFASSIWILESYGWKGVRAIAPGGSAVAPEERDRRLLTSLMLWWKGDRARDRDAAVLAGRTMQEVVGGKGVLKHTYVNYAKGGEELGELYGHDVWRRVMLRFLKRRWDRENRFGFYNPIV
ncbi:FAD-binding, type 2 [Metarhizium rileyi]|uniref:FAD-binding, type 2 n=1 Tax=Metarhizium rileyi (strain RCEF 4871) TaxID=1649241 RepID=A0A167FS65_METRR|nr:FAD-binding, type 2 [Metarhizium rileyi RCEF 4871]